MCRRPGQRGDWSTFLSRNLLAYGTGFKLRPCWRQWRPVVPSQWMNIMTSFTGHVGHLHRNHCVLLKSQKSWMFSQMPPAVEKTATLPLLKKTSSLFPAALSSSLVVTNLFPMSRWHNRDTRENHQTQRSLLIPVVRQESVRALNTHILLPLIDGAGARVVIIWLLRCLRNVSLELQSLVQYQIWPILMMKVRLE